MQKIIKLLIIVAVVVVLAFAAALKTPFVKYPISLYLSSLLKSDILIKKCTLSFAKGITASDITIKNKKGLYCFIKDARINSNFFGLMKRELLLDCSLKTVRFSYSASEIMNGIAKLFAIGPAELLEFDTVDGAIHIRPKEMVVKDLNAVGKEITVFLNGTTKDDKYINYTLRLSLSESFTSRIPEAIRQLFFRKEDARSTVELYLSGSSKKPSINFSAPLFKLLIK